MEKPVIAKGTVNRNAYHTWLEPYIAWEFDIVKYNRSSVWFLMDNGKPKRDITKYDADVFDIKPIALSTNN